MNDAVECPGRYAVYRYRVPAISLFAMMSVAMSPTLGLSKEKSVARDAERCQQDPRFRVGGAAIGDCLLELNEVVDMEIEAAITVGVERYSRLEDREEYMKIQASWQLYRDRLCHFVERSPGNTVSWVNAAACRLELGRQRLQALRYTNEYGSPSRTGKVGND